MSRKAERGASGRWASGRSRDADPHGATPDERRFRWALGLGAALVAIAGWRVLLFLTDDAFIAFRYVGNRMLGHGWVWNAAPFQPVEGYTSFLWALLLEAVWRVTGIEPPQSANGLSLVFGLGTLLLAARMLFGVRLGPALAPVRRPLLALALLGIVTNRTWLTWLSSGLETALFNFCLTAWVFFAWRVGREAARAGGRTSARSVAGLASAAAATALARPDGLLFAAATVAIGGVVLWRQAGSGARGGAAAGRAIARTRVALLPLFIVPAHLFFRRAIYGEWLPNTYWAKYTSPWAESGVRYLASFVVEYAFWVWGALALAWAIGWTMRRPRRPFVATLTAHAIPILVVATVVAHAAYYTFRIGGDHFEFRVYSQLVPLLFVSAVWLTAHVERLAASGRAAIGVLAISVVLSWPIPWVHWNATRSLTTREETQVMIVPIASRFPPVVRIPVGWWDGWQEWLIRHHVGMRRRGHQVFCEGQLAFWPTREEGARIGWEQRAVLAAPTVGVPGWVLPEVAIIDLFGLNDRVIARSPAKTDGERLMAHERTAPPGYVAAFRPNVFVNGGRIVVAPRAEPLTDARIRAIEAADWNAPPGESRPAPGSPTSGR